MIYHDLLLFTVHKMFILFAIKTKGVEGGFIHTVQRRTRIQRFCIRVRKRQVLSEPKYKLVLTIEYKQNLP